MYDTDALNHLTTRPKMRCNDIYQLRYRNEEVNGRYFFLKYNLNIFSYKKIIFAITHPAVPPLTFSGCPPLKISGYPAED